MIWSEIILINPEIETLRLRAFSEKSKSWNTWEMYKNRISNLVGWNSTNEKLMNEYDFVYQTIRTNFERKHA